MEVAGFDSLTELALDMYATWNHYADDLWRELDPEVWEITHNPWVVLRTVARDRIEHMLAEAVFRKSIAALVQDRRQAVAAPAGFQQCHSSRHLTCTAHLKP